MSSTNTETPGLFPEQGVTAWTWREWVIVGVSALVILIIVIAIAVAIGKKKGEAKQQSEYPAEAKPNNWNQVMMSKYAPLSRRPNYNETIDMSTYQPSQQYWTQGSLPMPSSTIGTMQQFRRQNGTIRDEVPMDIEQPGQSIPRNPYGAIPQLLPQRLSQQYESAAVPARQFNRQALNYGQLPGEF